MLRQDFSLEGESTFVRDRQAASTARVSVGDASVEGNGGSTAPAISSDGRCVAYQSYATNLVLGDSNGYGDIFVRDRVGGTVERVSVSTGGAQSNNNSFFPSIGGGGRYVAFQSVASTLVAADTNGLTDVFVHDRVSGETARVSLAGNGAQGANHSFLPAVSANLFQPRLRVRAKRDVLADDALDHFGEIADRLAQIHVLQFEHLFAAESQQLPDQRGRAVGRIHHPFNIVVQWAAFGFFQG